MTTIDARLRNALAGISGILVTPFDSADRLAPARLEPIVDRAVAAGVHALVANGNTGEFYGLTTKEAETMVHAVAEQTARLRRLKALAPRVPKRQRVALFNRLQAARLPIDLLDPRITTEIAVFAERCDITEELARLESHLGQFGDHLESHEPVGRTLEFLAQEMGREWHTTGAKANDAEISLLVVEAKAELDKAREQLANVE